MPYVAHDDEGPLSPRELPGKAEEAEEAQEAKEAEEAEDAVKAHPGSPTASGGAAPRRQAAVVRDTAPLVGSDGSSEEGPAVARRGRRRSHELRARIRACQREQQRLRAEYEVEVQHCADLRDALEARENEFATAREPLQVQLQQAHEALELADRTECEALMQIEDDLAYCARLLESKDRDVRDLESRLNDIQQGYHKFLRDGPPTDTVVEEALHAADKEMHQLLSGVQLREQVIANLNADVRSALEYMIAANVEAVGGPSHDLGLEDFLPSSVREHLGLSEHGSTHLAILYKKYELIMAEQRPTGNPLGTKFHDGNANNLSDQSTCTSSKEAGAAARQNAWHISDLDSSRRSSQLGEHASELTSQSGPCTPLEAGLEEVMPPSPAPTLAAGLLPETMTMPSPSEAFAQMMPAFSDMWARQEDLESSQVPVPPLEVAGDDDGVWDLAAEEAWPSSGSRAAAGEALPTGRPSASLEEESRVLREAMAQELRRLAEALVPSAFSGASGTAAAAVRAGRELRRAAAQGDEKAVRHWLPQAASAPAGGADAADAGFLGWTAWHVAAAYGQCGVLECLKEDLCQQAVHHLSALDRRTPLGLPPLGAACLAGRVEAARSLLLGMAPVDVRDTRGNTPLLWAVIGGQARALVPLLLDVRADPEAANRSGQRPDIAGLLGGCSMTTLMRPDTGTAVAVGPVGAAAENGAAAPTRQDLPPERFGEAYHLIRTTGAEPSEEPGLLSYTLGMLKVPVRDAVGFGRNAKAKQLAQLSAAEEEMGVWSEWVSNYTHAGLHAAVEVGRQNADPLLRHRNRQALVLTTERLLLFNARNWSLVQVIALSELAELTVSSFSSSVLILRMHRLPDAVLDIAVPARGRLIDELQLAVGTVALKWGGADFGGGLRIRHDCEPVVELFDERRKRAGTLAYIEAHVFLLLPHAPNSLLLLGGDTFFFGLLDMHQSSTAARGSLAGSVGLGWKWQTYFFILKSAPGEGRKLLWCQHPNDERCLGSVHIGRLLAVQPLDTPKGEACLIIDYGADERAHALTLRAPSAQNREDWIVSLRTMQTGL